MFFMRTLYEPGSNQDSVMSRYNNDTVPQAVM